MLSMRGRALALLGSSSRPPRRSRRRSPRATRAARSRSWWRTAPADRPTWSRARSRRNSRSGSASRWWCSTRPGGSGTIGATLAARAAPDGYTLYVGYTSEVVVVPQVSKSVKYSIDDFEPIAVTGLVPLVLISSKNVRANNLQELIAELRAAPGKYTYGGGVASPPHVMGAWFNRLNKLDVVHVPYRGGAQAVADVIGGHVDLFFAGLAAAKAAIDSGSVKPFAVTGRRALGRAAERADLQGSRRRRFRAGELERAAGAEGHAARHPGVAAAGDRAGAERSQGARDIVHARRRAEPDPGRAGVSGAGTRRVRPRGARARYHDRLVIGARYRRHQPRTVILSAASSRHSKGDGPAIARRRKRSCEAVHPVEARARALAPQDDASTLRRHGSSSIEPCDCRFSMSRCAAAASRSA